MNTAIAPFTKSLLSAVLLCSLAALLCACAATSLRKTWKAADISKPAGKIAVIAIDDRGLVRQGFENRFVAQLTETGASAVTTFDQLSLKEIKEDKKAAAALFKASGAESVLIFRVAGSASQYRETQPGGERYASTVSGYENWGWYDYYSVGFMSMSPTYGNLTQKVYLEAVLYDLNSEKRLWSGVTETVAKENTDKVAEMDPVVAKIVQAMKKDSVIP